MPLFRKGCEDCAFAKRLQERSPLPAAYFATRRGHTHLLPANETAGEEIEAKRTEEEERRLTERRDLASFLRRRADRDEYEQRVGLGAGDHNDLRRAADLLDPDGPEGL